MSIHRMILLGSAAILAGSLHAQVCSGGTDGGMDATGNQCTDPGTAISYAATPTSTLAPRTDPARADAPAGPPAPRATPASMRPPPQTRSSPAARLISQRYGP